MNSKDQFEKWLDKQEYMTARGAAEAAWKAGRESMRDEAAQVASLVWLNDPDYLGGAFDQIMKIEP